MSVRSKKTKYIFVTGGVVSGLGKGLTAASLGFLLKARGLNIKVQKFDPYINVDPGTMNPIEHGEVFVTSDGAETDLDLGHYERFINIELSGKNSVSTGQIYQTVLDNEREGKYLGKTIQVIPHITDEIKRRMTLPEDKNTDIIIIEVGGTVGDIESYPFIEAVRQLRHDLGFDNTFHIHCTLIPYMHKVGEYKSKPTQQSLKELRSLGVQPDAVVGRIKGQMPEDIKDKISLFGNIDKRLIFESVDVEHIYDIPLKYEEQFMAERVMKGIGFDLSVPDMTPGVKFKDMDMWETMVKNLKEEKESVNIAVVGKYTELEDAYLSIKEALYHAGVANNLDVEIAFIDAEYLEDLSCDEAVKITLKEYDGILVPGGFGKRGIEGKIKAARYARKNNVPYFGICLGMQVAAIEYARNKLGLEDANSLEFDSETKNPVITLMNEQKEINNKGGTMRLGSYDCTLDTNSKAYGAYKEEHISERHRHRFEFNNYFTEFFEKGMIVTGINPDLNLAEIIEIEDHPWFVGVQFHPEFKSRPLRPHPLFVDFIKNASTRR
jgi:CTP synthase